jgi:hypothetical protein
MDAECHIYQIFALERLNGEVRDKLRTENRNKDDLLIAKHKIIEKKDEEIEELRNESRSRSELLASARKKIEKRDELLRLANKPLPKLPSKFKIFRERTKTKFQNLVEKTKRQSRELFTRIEVKVK